MTIPASVGLVIVVVASSLVSGIDVDDDGNGNNCIPVYKLNAPPWENPAKTIRFRGKPNSVISEDIIFVSLAWDSSIPLQNSFDRLSSPTISYHDGMAMPIFIVTLCVGAVGNMNFT